MKAKRIIPLLYFAALIATAVLILGPNAFSQKPAWSQGVTITGHVSPGATVEIAGQEADIWPHIAPDGSFTVRLMPNDALHPYTVFYRTKGWMHGKVKEYRWIVPASAVAITVDQVQKEAGR
jgi:hypothetical protein